MLLTLILDATLVLGLASCGSGNGQRLGERIVPIGERAPKGGGVYMVGQPYEVDGIRYYPREDLHYDRVGYASWYGELFHGRRTANGEIYDVERLSAASPTLPLPVYVRVTNLNNGRSLVLRVNDRGPYASSRIMDVSRRAAELLDFRTNGTTKVRVQYLGPAPLNGDDSYEQRYADSQRFMHYAANTERLPADPTAVGSLPNAPQAKPTGRKLTRSPLPPPMPAEADAAPVTPQLRWQASATPPPVIAKRGRTTPASMAEAAPAVKSATNAAPGGKRLLVQAGSFKSKDNADKARSKLAGIAPVDVAPIPAGADTMFRVRIGPFASASDAASALARVTGAGYADARIVSD